MVEVKPYIKTRAGRQAQLEIRYEGEPEEKEEAFYTSGLKYPKPHIIQYGPYEGPSPCSGVSQKSAARYPHSYEEAAQSLGKRERRCVANHTFLYEKPHAGHDDIAIRLHRTDIATFHSDGSVTLDSGGWKTVTTKARINAALPEGFYLYSEKGVWYLIGRGLEKEWEFYDGIMISADGTVN